MLADSAVTRRRALKCERPHRKGEASHKPPEGDGLPDYPEGLFQPQGPEDGEVPPLEERRWPMCRSYRIPKAGLTLC